MGLWQLFGESATTSLGFFWKAGWAFVLGYAVSGAIQAFVPRARLAPLLGGVGPKSVSLATLFGAASSSCSFAALAAARALVSKGASFVAAVAFMFASTNLVIELGILILIFLGWQFLAAELIGGLLLIVLSSVLLRTVVPSSWLDAARDRVGDTGGERDEFDWRRRVRSLDGWRRVGRNFVADWRMVWQEVVIGFTIAGLVAVVVPPGVWEALFLQGLEGSLPGWVIALENAAIAPFVAAATFIGSMGNIPLATVLDANGVLFAGIMGFIYSDLMVPPLVMINAKYYGWRPALAIAGVMFVSIVATALALHGLAAATGLVPRGGRAVEDVTRFAIDYTFWLDLAFALVAAGLVWLARSGSGTGGGGMRMEGGGALKRGIALACVAWLAVGLVVSVAAG